MTRNHLNPCSRTSTMSPYKSMLPHQTLRSQKEAVESGERGLRRSRRVCGHPWSPRGRYYSLSLSPFLHISRSLSRRAPRIRPGLFATPSIPSLSSHCLNVAGNRPSPKCSSPPVCARGCAAAVAGGVGVEGGGNRSTCTKLPCPKQRTATATAGKSVSRQKKERSKDGDQSCFLGDDHQGL